MGITKCFTKDDGGRNRGIKGLGFKWFFEDFLQLPDNRNIMNANSCNPLTKCFTKDDGGRNRGIKGL